MSSMTELEPAPQDAISSLAFSRSSTKLLVGSWDKTLYLYDTRAETPLQQKFEHRAPILDVCFGDDDDTAYTGGLDWDARKINLRTGEQIVLSTHDAPIKSVAYSPEHKLLVTASWDSTLHLHLTDPTTTSQPSTVPLTGKPFAMAISSTKLIVAMSARQVHIYELAALAQLASQAAQPPPNTIELEPFQRRESSLKFMTRALACMPSGEGYASSSIEGRVAVEWFDAGAESQARKYAFKCHRQPAEDDPGVDIVYPVHALAFHPVHGTFVSGGGDGVVALWNAVAKRRIRQYQRFPTSVAAMEFSSDGKQLAIAVSPGFEEGKEEVGEGVVKVYIRELGDNEAKEKSTKG